jgi:uncharacterized repeat protein (TIGR03803 family)
VTGKKETVHSFKGSPNGANPSGRLIRDAEGNLYGVTFGGGVDGSGALFTADAGGAGTVLYSGFCKNSSSSEPGGKLVMDAEGNLYGTTRIGGTHGSGTVFKVDPSGTGTVLYNFCSQGSSHRTDGEEPNGGLVIDSAGNPLRDYPG